MKKLILLLMGVVFMLAASGVRAYGADIHVPADYPTIQAAINAAADYDTVVVEPNTYYENINIGGKKITLTSTNPGNPAIVAATIINGNNNGSVVTFAGTETADCQLTGFTITGGYSPTPGGCGGGIRGYGTQAGISKCIIRDNIADWAGGGIHRCDGIISDCRIITNKANKNVGGGLAGCHGKIINCLIADNTAQEYGGGVYINCNESTVTITDCNISGNAAKCGGGIAGENDSSSDIIVTGCTINDNSASRHGGGTFWLEVDLNITNSKIIDNEAAYGGGTFCFKSNVVISNCIIKGNHTEGYDSLGGGIACHSSDLLIKQCVITENGSRFVGGIICSYSNCIIAQSLICGNNGGEGGGGIDCRSSSIRINNCTVADNKSYRAGGIGVDRGNVVVRNSILWGNGGSHGEAYQIELMGWYDYKGVITLGYCDIEGLQEGINIRQYGELNLKAGNINEDPMFIQPGHWDDNGTPDWIYDDVFLGGNYHLLLDSPCINAGDPDFVVGNYETETDMDGDSRVFAGRVDIGADEFVSAEPVIWLSSDNFTFTAPEGCSNPDEQILYISSMGPGTINWEISYACDWLDASPAGGQSSGELDEVSLTADVTGLESGTYNCTLTITAAEATNSPRTVSVSLLIPEPVMELSTNVIGFAVPEGGSNPQDKILTISNSGGGFFNWQIDTSCPWLGVSATSGQAAYPADVTLSADTTGLTEGLYSSTLRVSNTDAVDVFQDVEVYLYLYSDTPLVVPDQYETIQAAIDEAVDGNTIIVCPDTYYERISFVGKNIVLTSLDPTEPNIVAATVIDGGSTGSVVTFAGTETADCQLTGFTITGGYSSDTDGGIRGNGNSAGISKCIVRDNVAESVGGGIRGCNGIIRDCQIIANKSNMHVGGGLAGCHGKIINCLIADNTAEKAAAMYNCDGEIINCTIADNKGASEGAVKNCDGSFTNCIIWGNSPDDMFNSSLPTYSCSVADDVGISYWKFDGNADDEIGTNDGTVYGAGLTTGISGQAYQFDGVGNYIDLGNDSSLKPQLPVTLSAWINFSEAETRSHIIHLGDSSSSHCGIGFRLNATDCIVAAFGDDGGQSPEHRRTKTGTTSLNIDTWYHVTAVIRGATDMDLYIDGTDDGGTYSGTGGSLAYSTGSSFIGSTDASWNFFKGSIDEVAVYKRALTTGDIQQLYLDGHSYKNRHNINADPHFVDANNGDYRLLSDSPCIDAGDPNYAAEPNETDLDDNPRVIHGRIDMGAYELAEPVFLLDFLAQDIIDLELQQGIENSLFSKLDTALEKLEDDNQNDNIAAINSLQAFINFVEAQRGKKISPADADTLIATAQEIIDLLNDEQN